MKKTSRNEMNTKIFWEIIKKGREAADAHKGDFYDCLHKMHASVKKQLKKLTPEAIYKWYEIFEKKENDLDDADLWFLTGGSDDGFAYARRWIISKGERIYNAVKKNPKALPKVAPDYYGASFEGLPYAAIEAYDEVAGNSFYDYQDLQWQFEREKRSNDNPDEELTWDKSDNIITQRFNRLVRDSKKGDAESQFDLASTYAHGWGIDQDDKKVIYWLTKAADQDFLKAQIRLALCYSDGDHVKQNYEKAVFWYTKAAEQGDGFAQSMLGIFYSNGVVPEDEIKSAYWYKKAAEQGDAFSQDQLGNCYAYGYGLPQDDKQAVYWIRKAVKQGNADAQNRLGVCYSDGSFGVRKNRKKASELFLKAAIQGHAGAQGNLGSALDADGDTKQAIYWWTKAAEQGYDVPQMILASVYFTGDGVRKNNNKAFYWYKKAAAQGETVAIRSISVYYWEGKCVKRDRQLAAKWCLVAANKGCRESQDFLGDILYEGKYLSKDEDAAVFWWIEAALQGQEDALDLINSIEEINLKEEAAIREKDDGSYKSYYLPDDKIDKLLSELLAAAD